MIDRPVADRISGLFESRWMRGYVRGKLRSDAVYAVAIAAFRGTPHPIVDLGCGAGLLAFLLREHGVANDYVGLDFDRRKIEAAERIAPRYNAVRFFQTDVRNFSQRGSFAMLDVLHYFRDSDQVTLLERVAEATEQGGVVVLRDCVRDASWRFRLTRLQERFSRAIGWLRGDTLNFPTREAIERPFVERGFEVESRLAAGRLPFNNYVFIFRRVMTGQPRQAKSSGLLV